MFISAAFIRIGGVYRVLSSLCVFSSVNCHLMSVCHDLVLDMSVMNTTQNKCIADEQMYWRTTQDPRLLEVRFHTILITKIEVVSAFETGIRRRIHSARTRVPFQICITE